ncbi:N-acylneuraminate-9-phosphatase [Lucilia cuprina]|nr:N-acylneuraminate-9-phosphatase [Lucilia cuprina]
MASTNLNFNNTCPSVAKANNTQHHFQLAANQKLQQKQQHVYNLSKVTTIFFDLDNTLTPTRSGDSKACRKVSERLEIQYGFTKEEANYATQNFLKSFRRCPDNAQTPLDTWRTHLWRESLPPKYKQFAESIYPLWLEMRYCYLAIPDDYIKMLMRFRQANYRLALITNGPSNAQWEKIRKLHVQPYFDCVLVSADLPWEKPDPNIFYAACKYLNVQPDECIMIGDKLESDIKGGNLAGLAATFWLPLTPDAIKDLNNDDDVDHKPTHILRNLLDLYKYFNFNIKQQINEEQQVPVYNSQSNHKYRCTGDSLPTTIDYLISSETDNSSENSSDSIN